MVTKKEDNFEKEKLFAEGMQMGKEKRGMCP